MVICMSKKKKVESLKDARRLNNSLLGDSLALAATQDRGVDDNHNMEEREARIAVRSGTRKKAKR